MVHFPGSTDADAFGAAYRTASSTIEFATTHPPLIQMYSPTCSDIIDDLLDRTPAVIDRVSGELPAGFPPLVAEAIFEGVKQCADELG
ncbi:MAG: type II toxin-antitoxin system HipA family toxin [Chlorobiaceae bacterium]|nr:type II toxin-antitoxin system HipA family toxin [Chlorobiaceae bacterium]